MLTWVLGCALPPPPTLEGWRGGAGYWPENSRAAIDGAVDTALAAIHLDAALTADGQIVLARDGLLRAERCTHADGAPLERNVVVRKHDLQELSTYRCGGSPDPEFPNAVVVAEAPVSLDALIDALHAAPTLAVHLELGVDPPLTPAADRIAPALVDRWLAADLPNDLVVSSSDPAVLRAFDDRARALGADLFTVLRWPGPGDSATADAIEAEAERWVGGLDYVAVAGDADGLLVPHRLADPWQLRAAGDAGLPVWVEVGPDPVDLADAARWRVDTVLTPYPGDLP
ncbi:MAG: glycerophosphodiester phosphodiesterase family protein [Myxococcota bacterium]